MRTITATIPAWLVHDSCFGVQDLKNSDAVRIINGVSFMQFESPDYLPAGWTRVGEASIVLTLVDEDALLANKVDALRREQKETLAEAQAKVTRLQGQIEQLLAITHEPQAGDVL
jgi:hypothetical protein